MSACLWQAGSTFMIKGRLPRPACAQAALIAGTGTGVKLRLAVSMTLGMHIDFRSPASLYIVRKG